jgi:outer membrane protein assembly factor BamD
MRLLLTKILFIICCSFLLQGCDVLKNLNLGGADEEKYVGWDAEKLHNSAQEAIDNGNYNKAIEFYEVLQTRYPFGQYAAQTQLDIAYAYYKNGDSEAAIAAADRFIKIYPRNPSVDYAYYLKGLVNYNRGIGFLDRFLPTDSSQRDPGTARDAYENFDELVRRFPESVYVPDAKKRMIALRNNLGMYEIHVARYYMMRKAYVAAANRASYVIEQYQRTPAVPYALEIMQEAYTKLGLEDLAKDAERIYALNYPNGPPVLENKRSGFIHTIWDFIALDH